MSRLVNTTLRRLRIYYLNNKRTSKFILFLLVCLLVYIYVGTNLFRRKTVAIVGYRYDDEDEMWMSDGEVENYLNALEDTRPQKCLDQAYDFTRTYDIHETVSLIMHFHAKNDLGHFKLAISAIVDHTPFDLYEEIIVIDDGTREQEYKQKVASFLASPRFNKVKLYRSEQQDGTASTRHKATLLAKGTILIFVSSSVIVNHGWAQPLIAKLAKERDTIVVPHFDNMLGGHRFFKTEDNLVNTFSWSMYTVTYESDQDKAEEFLTTSVMRGEVLAVKKVFLESLGGYDDHFEANGGGENLELSFRAWLCGGKIKVAKCSRVAVHSSLRPLSTTSPANYRRIIDLWLNDYRSLSLHQGNISGSMEQRESETIIMRKGLFKQKNLQCQDFTWYLNHVATEVMLPSDNFERFGKLKTKAAYCLKAGSEVDVEMVLCRHHIYDRSMLFEMDKNGAIFRGDSCLTLDDGTETGIKNKLIQSACDEGSAEQTWIWRGHGLTLKSRPGQCLTQVSHRDKTTMVLSYYAKLAGCSEDDYRVQTWEFITY